MVHWNSASYGSFSEAKIEDDGLAVLGIFVEVWYNYITKFLLKLVFFT